MQMWPVDSDNGTKAIWSFQQIVLEHLDINMQKKTSLDQTLVPYKTNKQRNLRIDQNIKLYNF